MSSTATRANPRTGPFIPTKEHRRFVEFADAVRREAFIGVCYGPAGVGKTLSARRYTHWDLTEDLLASWGPRAESDANVYAALARSRTVFYTPPVQASKKQLVEDITRLIARVDICIDQHLSLHRSGVMRRDDHAELVVIDEAERLSPYHLEHLRDRYDRRIMGLLLIGMPGLPKRLAGYLTAASTSFTADRKDIVYRAGG